MKLWIILIVLSSGLCVRKTTQADTVATTAAPVPKHAFFLCMEITNRVYNASLQDPNSAYYKSMYNEVSGALDVIYSCSNCDTDRSYQGVAAMTFSSGSVIANSTIVFQTSQINNVLVKFLFKAAIPANNQVNGLIINRKYTEETFTPIPAALPTSSYTTTTTPLTRTSHSTSTSHHTTSHNTTSPHTTSRNTTSRHTTSRHTTSRNTTSRNTTSRQTTTVTPIHNSTTTPKNPTIKPSNIPFPTTSRHHTSQSHTSHQAHNSTSSTTKRRKTEAIQLPTTSNPATGAGNNRGRRVPGWAIALLVLACIILLLLIILLIIMLLRCCRRDKKPKPEAPAEQYQHTPYERTTFKEPLSTPSYSPQAPYNPAASPFEDPTKPNLNRSGMYVVNPGT